MEKEIQTVEEKQYTKAEDFLDALRPSKFYNHYKEELNHFIFRGQADADWTLAPSAFRLKGTKLLNEISVEKIEEHHFRKLITKKMKTKRVEQKRANMEYEALCYFVEKADRIGLVIPGLDFDMRQKMIGSQRDLRVQICLNDEERKKWPDDKYILMLALAQHYGVPTRLLDWTDSPFIAAYFAAQGACEKKYNEEKPPEKLVVWALNIRFTNYESCYSLRNSKICKPKTNYELPIIIYRAPMSNNENLMAQQGLLTLCRSLKVPYFNEEPEGMESLDTSEEVVDVPMLTKFELVYSEAAELLRLLDLEGINASTMFPGFGGVAKHVIERTY